MNLAGTHNPRSRSGPRKLTAGTVIYDLLDHETFSTQATGANWDSHVISGGGPAPGPLGALRVTVRRAGGRDASPAGEPRPFCVLVTDSYLEQPALSSGGTGTYTMSDVDVSFP